MNVGVQVPHKVTVMHPQDALKWKPKMRGRTICSSNSLAHGSPWAFREGNLATAVQ
jgi:hypothetical protein